MPVFIKCILHVIVDYMIRASFMCLFSDRYILLRRQRWTTSSSCTFDSYKQWKGRADEVTPVVHVTPVVESTHQVHGLVMRCHWAHEGTEKGCFRR